MLLWSMLVRLWQGSRSEFSAAKSISVSASTLSNWKDRSGLPPLTRLDGYCDALGLDREEGRAVVMIERRASNQGLELARVISVADDGYSAELELIVGGKRLVARVEPQLSGAPISIVVGDIAATDCDIVCWTAVDERRVIERQRLRVAAEQGQASIAGVEQIAKGACPMISPRDFDVFQSMTATGQKLAAGCAQYARHFAEIALETRHPERAARYASMAIRDQEAAAKAYRIARENFLADNCTRPPLAPGWA